MAIDLRNITALETKLAPAEFTKVTSFITTADTAKTEDVKAAYLTDVMKVDPQDSKALEEHAKEEAVLEIQIREMVNRWLRTSVNEVVKEDQDYLCDLAKKMYYERLRTGESRQFWRVLKEYITGVKAGVF